MQRFLPALLSAFATITLASSAQAICRPPVGGSENSVGMPSGERYKLLAIAAFTDSADAEGQRRLLIAHDFCTDLEPEATIEALDCDENDACDVRVSVSQTFTSAALGERTVSGVYTHDDRFGWTSFRADDLDVDGVGTRAELEQDASRTLMDTMRNVGITDPSRALGAQTLSAGRLDCSHPVVPNPVAHCSFTVGTRRIQVTDADTSAALEQILMGLDAYARPVLIGAVNTTVALVQCRQVVVPNAVPSCSVVVE